MKNILIILLLFTASVTQAQTVVIPGWTKVQMADTINTDLIELMDYQDVTLKTTLDTLSDTHGSVDLVALNTPFYALADSFGITLTDSLIVGMKGVRLRLGINTIFQELYVYMNANMPYSVTYLATKTGDVIMTKTGIKIILY